ncbi:MAG TPA: ABC transporter permease [Gallionellaceae bacterium]|nr:ABC transporter permease [Gallionellaceae bacterium]
MIRLIALKELRSLFHAPSTWYILGGMQLVLGWLFLALISQFMSEQTQLALNPYLKGATEEIVPWFFREIVSPLLMVVTPIFAMRLMTDERRNQTLALLLSAPVSSAGIVLGKFAGLLTFLWLVILFVAAMNLTLNIGTEMDIGLLLSNVAGLLLLAAANGSLALYISSLTAQPLAAAIAAEAALLGPWLIERNAFDRYRFWQDIAPSGHFHHFNSGLLDSGDAIYYLVFTVFFLTLAIRRLDNTRIYG